MKKTILLTIAAALLVGHATADLKILTADKKASPDVVSLGFTPRDIGSGPGLVYIPEGFEDLGPVGYAQEGELDALLVESILLPVDESAIAVTVVDAPEGVAEAITTSIVTIGSDFFAQVIVDPRAISSDSHKGGFDFSVRIEHGSLKQKSTIAPTATPDGTHRIVYTTGNKIIRVPLTTLGIDETALASARFVHHGETLPVGGVIDGDVWLYAPRRHTLTDLNDSIFFLAGAGDPSATMTVAPALPTLSPASAETSTRRVITLEENTFYRRTVDVVPNWGRFFWALLNGAGNSFTYQLPMLDHITSEVVVATPVVIGGNTQPAVNPDHYGDFSLAGFAAPRFSYNGRVIHAPELSIAIPPAALPLLPPYSFAYAVPTGTPAATGGDIQVFERLTLDYEANLKVGTNNRTLVYTPSTGIGPAGTPELVTIAGLPQATPDSDIVLLDVTDPHSPVRLTGFSTFIAPDGSKAVEFERLNDESPTYFLGLLSSAPAPDAFVPVRPMPSPLTAPGAELRAVYVADQAFHSELDRLAAIRGADSIIYLEPQAAYDAYNGGQQDPAAIRSAIAHLMSESTSRRAVPEILLVGHGSLDPRNYLGNQVGYQIPPFVEDSIPTGGSVIENPIDFPFTLLFGEDGFPDASFGRFPARTVAEATIMIDRILAHEALLETYIETDRLGVFVNDNDAEFEFDRDNWGVYFENSGKPSHTINMAVPVPNNATTRNAVAAAARAEMIPLLEEAAHLGASLLMYTGHGNNTVWANEGILNTSHVPGIATANQWPLVATFTCLNSYFAAPNDVPSNPCLSDVWVKTPTNGAVASIAPGSIDFYSVQSLFARQFLDQLGLPNSQRPATIGELMQVSQTNYLTSFPALGKTPRVYIIFGDPGTPHGIIDPNSSVDAWQLYAD